MGSDVLIRIRKCVVICTRVCCRSVRGHPILIGFLCWLYCFYRYFPVLFSLVASASPVLITTALLLGTLLSYGDSNLPEFEEEEEVSERARSGSEGIVVDRDAGNVRSRVFRNVDSDDEGKKEDDSEDEFGDDEDDDNKPLITGMSRKGVFEKWVGDEVERDDVRSLEIDDEKGVSRELGEGSGSRRVGEGASHDGMSNVEYERLEAEDYHSLSGAVDDPFALNTVYTSFRLSPKREEADDHQGNDSQNENDHGSETESDENEEEDDDEDDSSDSESDANESSSPDASMTDIMPLLDELHPLLDEDAPQQAQGATSSTAQRSVDASSIDSGEDSENQAEDDGEDDNEEDAHSNKGEGDKPEITWTEDDQKNLMDMGTSELERNQRLENLIARRRLRKSMRLSDEKNLIDLESTDLPFNVPHISTLRRNPFDSPVDSYDAMGLPPIPGSAPSILQPRRNPFDLPYDQNEEKPILTGDNFAQEFIPPQRDAHFRRYESFSVGPVNGGTSRQDMRRRPYFVPERTAAEEAYASIQRQLSEVSESKASSVPETDSVSSASDDEDQKITEPDTLTETNMVSKDEHDSNHSEYESQSSEDAESVTDEAANMNVNQNEFEIQLGGSETLQETETHTASIEESPSSYVESGHSEINMRVLAADENSDGSSHSSPTAEMQAEQDEISMELGYVHDDFRQVGTDFSGSVETARSEMHLPIDQVDDGSDSSSVTSLSEANEEVSDTVGRMEIIEETGDIMEDESHSLVHSPVGESSVNLKLEIPDDHHIQEPVYDSSPTPVERVLLFSSASVDRQLESSEVGDTSHLSVEDENKGDKEPSYQDGNTQHDHVELRYDEIPADVGQTSSSTLSHQSIPTDATLLAAGDDHPHLEAEHVSQEDDGSSSSDTDSSEENSVNPIEDKDVSHVEVQSSIQIDSEAVVVQDSIVGPDASSDSDSLEDQLDTTTIEVHGDELPIPSSDDDDINQEQVLAGTSNQQVDSGGPSSTDADKNQLHETPTANSSFNGSQEITDSSSTVEAESVKKTITDEAAPRVIPEVSVAIPLKNRLIESIKGMSAGGVPSDKQDEFQTPVSARYFDFTSEGFQPNATGIDEDETEDFKELDEGMLAELDTIGDFSVPNIEASTVDDGAMTFHHIDDEVPVEEVILPSLLFGGRAAVLPENEDSKDVPMSEPNSPFSDTKEVSHETEELIPSTTDTVVKTETVPTSSVSSPNTDALEKTETEPPSSSPSSPKTESQKEGLDTRDLEHNENPKLSSEETPVKNPSKKEKSHDSSSSSSSSDSDSD